MHFVEIKDEQFEEFLRSLNLRKENKLKVVSPSPRTRELSVPKKKVANDFDEMVGPGSYNPLDSFLSTKNKTPSIVIGKSNRFITQKIPMINNSQLAGRHATEKTLKYTSFLSPRFSFKRTGHNLKLVDDIDVPGVGKYSPGMTLKQRAYSFKRSPRVFSWKTNIRNLNLIAQFEKRHWK